MIVATPCAADLAIAPELAILAALEIALAASIEAIAARHPEIISDSDFCDCGLATDEALALRRQASDLVATINRYRLSLVIGDDF
jgi:hypothetical protein